MAHTKFATKANLTPLSENNLLNGESIPLFISLILRKYDPKTMARMPNKFLGVGTSLIVNIAIKVVKAGLNELIGARSEIGDNFIARNDSMNAIKSKIEEASINIKNLFVM